jgi:glycosyltransferase involved in cell wall biosynthesis
MPSISIIIPAYNAATYLPQTLASCLAQTYPDYEIILVDDGSSDETGALARSYPEVTYIQQKNQGVAAARNTGIAHATGDYVQFLDADDVLLPEKLARCWARMQADPALDVVYTNYEYRNHDLSQALALPRPPIELDPGDPLPQLLNSTASKWGVHCALVKASTARRVDGFGLGFESVEDWHFWVKIAALGGKFAYIPEVLVWYRQLSDSLSSNPLRLNRARLKALQALRDFPLPPHFNLEGKIAGRHHALGVALWYAGQAKEARQELRQALALEAEHRGARRFLLGASYVMTASQADALLAGLLSLKRTWLS